MAQTPQVIQPRRGQERSEDSRPSFWDNPYEGVPVFLGVSYIVGVLIAIGIVWLFNLWPSDEDDGNDNKRGKRDATKYKITPSPPNSD